MAKVQKTYTKEFKEEAVQAQWSRLVQFAQWMERSPLDRLSQGKGPNTEACTKFPMSHFARISALGALRVLAAHPIGFF